MVRRVTLPADGPQLMSSTAYEYRTFGARGSFEPNGSATIRHFDALGRVVSEVRRGDPGGREAAAPDNATDVRAGAMIKLRCISGCRLRKSLPAWMDPDTRNRHRK